MADNITDGSVADVFVEDVSVVSNAGEDAYVWSNTEGGHHDSGEDIKGKGHANSDQKDEEDLDSDSTDEDYDQPLDEEDSSAEDEEVDEMRKFAKEVKSNIKIKKLGIHGSRLGTITLEALFVEGCNLEDEAELYADSSDDHSYEDNNEGETERWKSQQNKYDSKAAVPIFTLGMAFRCSRQFKKAVVKYRLRTHRHILCPKDDVDG
jgi:hypothetical protein